MPLGASWAPLGRLLGPLGRLLEASWRLLGELLARLGALLGRSFFEIEFGSIFGTVLGSSWAVLSALEPTFSSTRARTRDISSLSHFDTILDRKNLQHKPV